MLGFGVLTKKRDIDAYSLSVLLLKLLTSTQPFHDVRRGADNQGRLL